MYSLLSLGSLSHTHNQRTKVSSVFLFLESHSVIYSNNTQVTVTPPIYNTSGRSKSPD